MKIRTIPTQINVIKMSVWVEDTGAGCQVTLLPAIFNNTFLINSSNRLTIHHSIPQVTQLSSPVGPVRLGVSRGHRGGRETGTGRRLSRTNSGKRLVKWQQKRNRNMKTKSEKLIKCYHHNAHNLTIKLSNSHNQYLILQSRSGSFFLTFVLEAKSFFLLFLGMSAESRWIWLDYNTIKYQTIKISKSFTVKGCVCLSVTRPDLII